MTITPGGPPSPQGWRGWQGQPPHWPPPAYDLAVREATGGKVIEDSGTVLGQVNYCPMFVTSNAKSPMIYGSPDDRAVIDELAEFVGAR